VTASEDDSSPIIMVWDLRNARAPEKVRLRLRLVGSSLKKRHDRSSRDTKRVSYPSHGVNRTQICYFLVVKTTVLSAGTLRLLKSLEK
jgi:hypothetical protein